MNDHNNPTDSKAISHAPIKVIGVGGGGSNAVNTMYNRGITGVDFIVCNTDAQALDASPVPVKIQLGATLTRGQGAGSLPEVGRNAAIESLDDVKELIGEDRTWRWLGDHPLDILHFLELHNVTVYNNTVCIEKSVDKVRTSCILNANKIPTPSTYITSNIKDLKKNKKQIIGYGAPAKASTALNYFNISDEIDFIVEDNKLKHNKFIPGVKIPIRNKSYIKDKDNILLILAWNFSEDIKKTCSIISYLTP